MVSRSGLSFSAYCIEDKKGERKNPFYSFLFILFFTCVSFSRGNCICFCHGHYFVKTCIGWHVLHAIPIYIRSSVSSDINRSCLLLFRCLSLRFLACLLCKACFFSPLVNCILNSSDAIRQVRFCSWICNAFDCCLCRRNIFCDLISFKLLDSLIGFFNNFLSLRFFTCLFLASLFLLFLLLFLSFL